MAVPSATEGPLLLPEYDRLVPAITRAQNWKIWRDGQNVPGPPRQTQIFGSRRPKAQGATTSLLTEGTGIG